jgi:hypothetical protein
MLIVGEVHTRVLPTGDEFRALESLVALVAGESVESHQRPILFARSPETLVGVDCPVAAAGPVRQVRGIGTAVARASVTGGRIVQGSAYATVVQAGYSTRKPWSHYLARRGRIEALGRTRWTELADAFAMVTAAADTALDLGGIAGRVLERVRSRTAPDAADWLKATRTRTRWVARMDTPGVGRPEAQFLLLDDGVRVLRLTGGPLPAAALAAACEDIALHDWLLTTVHDLIRKARIGAGARAEVVDRLAPALDHLRPLWMPNPRGHEFTGTLWDLLDAKAGFERDWLNCVDLIRDQVSLAGVRTASLGAQPKA